MSKLYDVPVLFLFPTSFEAVYCYICGRRRVAVARYWMICLVIVPCFRESAGTLNLIRPSVRLSVCLSVRPSVTKTLTLAITFALLQVELSYLACVFFVTRPFRWYHVMILTVTFDLLQGQICCRAGDHNSLNLLVLEKWQPLLCIFHTVVMVVCVVPLYVPEEG